MLDGCVGAPTFLKAFLNQPLGHHLVAVNQKGDGLSDEAVPTVFVCVGCGAWAQQRRRQKLRRQCKPPTRQGVEVLTNLRRGLGPHKTLARHMDMTTPLHRMMLKARPPLRSKTCVTRPVAMAEPAGYEHKMAAIVERIKAKEKVKRDQDDDNNTILGRTRHAVPEVAEPQQGESGCTGTRTPAESLAPTEPAVPQWRHGGEVPPCGTAWWRTPTRE
jgi:hypothetical protein